jgi:hypothetical protein
MQRKKLTLVSWYRGPDHKFSAFLWLPCDSDGRPLVTYNTVAEFVGLPFPRGSAILAGG